MAFQVLTEYATWLLGPVAAKLEVDISSCSGVSSSPQPIVVTWDYRQGTVWEALPSELRPGVHGGERSSFGVASLEPPRLGPTSIAAPGACASLPSASRLTAAMSSVSPPPTREAWGARARRLAIDAKAATRQYVFNLTVLPAPAPVARVLGPTSVSSACGFSALARERVGEASLRSRRIWIL